LTADGTITAFRGFTAAASLKPGRQAVRCPAARSFPRFHRRGLIEATSRQRCFGIPTKAFRGFTAAASLKPTHLIHDVSSRWRAFRGFTAAASLKP